jgi:hypothetical protein
VVAEGHSVLLFNLEVNVSSRDLPKIMVRFPRDVKDWLVEQAALNASSQSSEIVRAMRERMQRVQNKTVALLEAVRQSPNPED